MLAEQDFDTGELLSVAVGDGDFDFDGAADVADGPAEAFRKGGADLTRGEHFVGESDSAGTRSTRIFGTMGGRLRGLTDARTISSGHL